MEKNYIIRCHACRWAEMTTGISADLQHLHEIVKSCKNCGGPRTFRCKNCGRNAKMFKVKYT